MAKKSFIEGHKYSISLKDESIQEGIFVFENDSFIYLKLGSGYNIGIAKVNISSSSEIEKKSGKGAKDSKSPSEKINDPEILIMHTGGTIASKVDYTTGAVNTKFTPDEMLDLFPELRNMARIDSKLIRNMWSDDMRLEHYNILAREIEKATEIKSLKGIILTHGTDTLHYTSSALSFMFERLPFPVVIVGSQRSSDRPSSDAALNLLSAAFFISKFNEHNLKGVFVCMHESSNDSSCVILPPQNIRKLHSSRRDAFKCVNCGPLAKVNFEHKKIELIAAKNNIPEDNSADGETNHAKEKTGLKLFNPDIKVGILKSRPGLYPEEFKVYEKFDGLILEGTGLGHFPIEQIDDETKLNKKIFDEIKKIASNKVVCMTTQTVFGRVNLNVYSPGRLLKDAGVLGHNLDMISETAYIKLSWLLSNYTLEEAKKLYSQNLRGEISERSEKEEFL